MKYQLSGGSEPYILCLKDRRPYQKLRTIRASHAGCVTLRTYVTKHRDPFRTILVPSGRRARAGLTLERLAIRSGHCEPGNRHRLASARVSPVLELEEPTEVDRNSQEVVQLGQTQVGMLYNVSL